MLKASLNSWICDWSNMAKTLEVARWGRFLVVLALARLLDILVAGGVPGGRSIRRAGDRPSQGAQGGTHHPWHPWSCASISPAVTYLGNTER